VAKSVARVYRYFDSLGEAQELADQSQQDCHANPPQSSLQKYSTAKRGGMTGPEFVYEWSWWLQPLAPAELL
jgi:hypothetical protein